MSFETDFLSMMTSQIEVKTETSVNGWGGSTFDAGRLRIPAKLRFADKIVRGDNDEQTNSTAQAVVPPVGYRVDANSVVVPTITTSSEVVVPDGTTRRVLSVEVSYDEDGPHHQTLMLT